MQRDWWWYSSDWTCERFSFSSTLWLENGVHWICNLALYHWIFSYFWFSPLDNFRYSTLVQRNWWVVLFLLHIWDMSFLPMPGFQLGISGSLILLSLKLPWCLLVFASDNFRYVNSGAEGLVMVLFWLDLWEISFCLQSGFKWDFWISSPELYHYAKVTSGFHLQ